MEWFSIPEVVNIVFSIVQFLKLKKGPYLFNINKYGLILTAFIELVEDFFNND